MSRARFISHFLCSGRTRAYRFRLARLSDGTIILAERDDHKIVTGGAGLDTIKVGRAFTTAKPVEERRQHFADKLCFRRVHDGSGFGMCEESVIPCQ
jgi:hypothetical protein